MSVIAAVHAKNVGCVLDSMHSGLLGALVHDGLREPHRRNGPRAHGHNVHRRDAERNLAQVWRAAEVQCPLVVCAR
jgi:hypothetical protein